MNPICPKVAAINDLSGFGRCSLTVAIPILSVMGVQCCPLPTAILSNHTGYESYFFDDFTDRMAPYAREWKKLGLSFDMIFTGFLGSDAQIGLVRRFIESFREGSLVLVDPVMADNGHIYSTYSKQMCDSMKQLITLADIITPNVTESCILTDTPYTGEDIDMDLAKELAKKLSAKGPGKVIITGIMKSRHIISNLAYDRALGEFSSYDTEHIHTSYPGTGDVFATIVCGELAKGGELPAALKKACDFIAEVIAFTYQNNTPIMDGILFEPFLKKL
ncbi:pyridoxamine kinase [Candidatus Soleaferrea massiliensis]|uniref:pyridoxamine kinase n=1 Tax=Candidatus Soleaferrea massiliensis TaxID=1470354 RepID=UPI00059115E8|nr:pyridoxamine kinase [Candidatus Soleaferrea massiliensis]